MATEPSDNKSNLGGYQGHYFNLSNMSPYISDDSLHTLIKTHLPSIETQPIKGFKYQAWVNVHEFGSSNVRHNHDPHAGTFMSGVLYVKCPEGCGKIRFYDPRGELIHKALDWRYYNGYDIDTTGYSDPKLVNDLNSLKPGAKQFYDAYLSVMHERDDMIAEQAAQVNPYRSDFVMGEMHAIWRKIFEKIKKYKDEDEDEEI